MNQESPAIFCAAGPWASNVDCIPPHPASIALSKSSVDIAPDRRCIFGFTASAVLWPPGWSANHFIGGFNGRLRLRGCPHRLDVSHQLPDLVFRYLRAPRWHAVRPALRD